MDGVWLAHFEEVDPPENVYRVEIPLFVEGKLWTVNGERSEHYHVHRRRTKEWREVAAFSALAAKVPRLLWMEAVVIPFQPRGVLADAGSHFPPVKASIDGFVDAGLLPDDSPEYVRSITMRAPRRDKTEPEGLLLLLLGERQH